MKILLTSLRKFYMFNFFFKWRKIWNKNFSAVQKTIKIILYVYVIVFACWAMQYNKILFRMINTNHGTKRRKVIKRRRKFDEETILLDNATESNPLLVKENYVRARA